MYSLPPDWRLRFMGSEASVAAVNRSAAIREHVGAGKLDLTYIPSNMSTNGQEMISRFLTTLSLYETILQPAELLLVFQTDSMICANSKHNIDEYLGYNWVGAPWDPAGTWGGNGGLSLRSVSHIIDVLRSERRQDDSDPEDVWLSYRLGQQPHGRVANGSVSLTFSGEYNVGLPEHVSNVSNFNDSGNDSNSGSLSVSHPGDFVKGIDDWREGYYEPMGYHIGSGGAHGSIWGTKEKREHIWQYCPEAKMIHKMDMAEFVPGNCGQEW
ncbi:hypothetical protein E5D57_013497 [Metarhizium anisopliae]|nr:hypothetical protein E5D57_013497 [Metarhizium anisopliae]